MITTSLSHSPPKINNIKLFRFLFESPRSVRNFSIILLLCVAIDHLLHTNSQLRSFVDVSLYQTFVKPWAANPMFEPQIAVLSFMISCAIFTFTKYFFGRGATAVKFGKKSQPESSSVKVFQGDFFSFAFWAFSNVGLYLGLVDIFQRISNYGGTLYCVNEHLQEKGEFLTTTRILLEICISVFGYDFLFSIVHASFHSPQAPQWWQKLHLTHHDHYQKVDKPLHVMVTFHHHIVDAAIQIMINAALQQKFVGFFFLFGFPRHTISKMLHNIFVTYLLVESHSGQDWCFMTHRWLFPEWFGGGANAHQQHHLTGKAPYHQFFTVFDDE